MDVKVIKTEDDYGRAIERLSELMTMNPDPSTAEANELELLALVISNYESKVSEPPVVDPIESILFRMDQAGLTRKDLVPFLGSESKVSEVLSRRRQLSVAMIKRLATGLGIPLSSLLSDSQVTEEVPMRRPLRRRKSLVDSLAFDPPLLIDKDYDDNSSEFVLKLDRPVSKGWIEAFYAARHGNAVGGYPPEAFRFRGSEARVKCECRHQLLQDLINHFKPWLPAASAEYRQRIERARASQADEERISLLRQQKADQERQEGLRNLTL